MSFDCVLIGDEHRRKNDDFEAGYICEAADGTPVFYTGPAVRISHSYRDRDAFVTEYRSQGTVSQRRGTRSKRSLCRVERSRVFRRRLYCVFDSLYYSTNWFLFGTVVMAQVIS